MVASPRSTTPANTSSRSFFRYALVCCSSSRGLPLPPLLPPIDPLAFLLAVWAGSWFQHHCDPVWTLASHLFPLFLIASHVANSSSSPPPPRSGWRIHDPTSVGVLSEVSSSSVSSSGTSTLAFPVRMA